MPRFAWSSVALPWFAQRKVTTRPRAAKPPKGLAPYGTAREQNWALRARTSGVHQHLGWPKAELSDGIPVLAQPSARRLLLAEGQLWPLWAANRAVYRRYVFVQAVALVFATLLCFARANRAVNKSLRGAGLVITNYSLVGAIVCYHKTRAAEAFVQAGQRAAQLR